MSAGVRDLSSDQSLSSQLLIMLREFHINELKLALMLFFHCWLKLINSQTCTTKLKCLHIQLFLKQSKQANFEPLETARFAYLWALTGYFYLQIS